MIEINVPAMFARDCLECDCNVGEVMREGDRLIRLRMTDAQLAELLSRAEHYANGGIDADGPFYRRLIRSAQATIRAIKRR